MRSIWRILPLAWILVVASSCSDPAIGGNGGTPGVAPNVWLGIPSAIKVVVEQVNHGTNWILNKSQVDVVKVGAVRPGESSESFVADFRIAVTHDTNSFETTAMDVPCDRDGIPTEASIVKLRQAVEDIKQKIRRLQN